MSLESLGREERLVAKIYDPLYFDDDDGYLNPFRCVDKHYTHEAHAYAELSDLQGHLVPKYYGSFSLDLCVGSKMRCVRLIVIEFIPGVAMGDANPACYSQPARQNIMKAVVDFETTLYTRNILHPDLHPRNIILISGSDSGAPERLFFIDFGGAIFGRTWDGSDVGNAKLFSGTYISPLLRWHVACNPTLHFYDWVNWDWQSWLEAEYKRTASTVTEEMRKVYLPDYLLAPPQLTSN
ncbi:hypothetical protein V1525DRAFT_149607 [Lipomyces kononenkoae]|uniref:Uncharacterized protein n=1 Tax=Lipomyces kononenkoae TaxID=34357 RepID=A0ACC3T1G2_LIPKO